MLLPKKKSNKNKNKTSKIENENENKNLFAIAIKIDSNLIEPNAARHEQVCPIAKEANDSTLTEEDAMQHGRRGRSGRRGAQSVWVGAL